MDHIVTVTLREQRISPKKAALVMSLIRGMKAERAVKELTFLNKKGARLALSLLKSGVDAATKKVLKIEELVISQSVVQEGKRMKRFLPKSRGRSLSYQKRMSHLKLSLAKFEPKETKERGKKVTKSIKKDKNGSES